MGMPSPLLTDRLAERVWLRQASAIFVASAFCFRRQAARKPFGVANHEAAKVKLGTDVAASEFYNVPRLQERSGVSSYVHFVEKTDPDMRLPVGTMTRWHTNIGICERAQTHRRQRRSTTCIGRTPTRRGLVLRTWLHWMGGWVGGSPTNSRGGSLKSFHASNRSAKRLAPSISVPFGLGWTLQVKTA